MLLGSHLILATLKVEGPCLGMKDDNEVTVVDLYDGYYLVETPTKFVVYQDLYDEHNRKKLWKVYKSQVDTLSEAVKMWLTSLN